MNELRLILIVVGIILILGIYWAGRREERKATKSSVDDHFNINNSNSHQQTYVTSPFNETHEISDYPRLNIDEVASDDEYYFDERNSDVFINTSESINGPTYVNGGISFASQITTSKTPISQPPAKQEPVPNTPALKTPVLKTSVSKTSASKTSASKTPSIREPIQPPTETESVIQTVELPAGIDPLIINITVMANEGRNFNPQYLKETLEELGLEHGELNIYHYYRKTIMDAEVCNAQRLFSVANAVRPGNFDPRRLNSYETPGVALFMQLPGPIDGVLAFEKMHQIGEVLAKHLGGVLCDDKHNKLTFQAIGHIKDQISEYNLKLQSKLKRTVH